MRIQYQRSGWQLLAAFSLLMLFGGLLRAQNQTILPPLDWATSVGGVNLDYIADAVGDGQGGLYVTGYTNSPNFPTTLPGQPGAGYDIFVGRFDSLGTLLWSTKYGGSGGDFGYAIARDPAGNLLIAGKLGGQGTFVTDSTYKGTGDDIVVLKMTSSGSLLAALRYGGTGTDEAVGIAVDANGQVLVVGNSSSSNIPTTSTTYDGTSGDAFVLRLRSNLSRHWAMRYGGNSFDKANDVAVDAQGKVYIVGETGSTNFPQTISTYQGSGGAKAFVMQLDSLGARGWAQRYGGAGVERAYTVDLPVNGGLLVGGYTTSPDFPSTITGLGGAGLDAMLIHFQTDGSRNFARRWGGSLDDLAIDIATDAAGNIFVAGETQSLNFPSTNNGYKGSGRDQFVAKFGPAGDYVWSLPYGGLANDFAGAALSSIGGSIYLAGHTQSLNFPQSITGTGGSTARGTVLRMRDCLGQNADFSFQNVCEFDTVHFVNLSLRGSSDTVAYRWWFGDGDSTDAIQPSHYYSVPGSYEVTLRVTSPCGLDSFSIQTVHVYPGPRAAWSHALSCASRVTAFTDSTQLDTIVGSLEAAWHWDFGDGDTAVLQHPTHIYAAAGAYPVTFTVWTNHGCSDQWTDTVQTHYRPYANFLAPDVCLRDTAYFGDSTQLAGDTLVAWAWDFGTSGATANMQHPSYLYALADTYAVQLIVQTNQGCADTAALPIRVLPLPVVNFGMTAVCWPDTVLYTDSTTIVGDMISGYTWHFGDAQTDTLQHTAHSYAASGSYDVVLWVSTASGCADSLLQTLKVNDKPQAAFGFMHVCYPELVAFTDSSAVLADSLVQWNWSFGDSLFDTLMNPSHSYALADTYHVALEVVSAFGCRDTIVQTVMVYPKPYAYFQPMDNCFPLPTIFQDSSNIVGDSLLAFDWNFGDGNTGSGAQYTYTYAAAGDYEVTLVVQTASGCSDTLVDSVFIFPQPVPHFLTENTCDGDTVYFRDSSTVSAGTIDIYHYDFGDGNGAMQADTAWIYANAGTYLVQLDVVSDKGCAGTVTLPVRVYALPDPAPTVVGYADICMGDTIQLREYQSFESYTWETGDTSDAITIFGRSDFVVLTVVDSNACSNSDSVEVRFHAVPRPNAVITPGPVVTACSADSLFLTAGGSYASYVWSDGETNGIRYVDQSGFLSVLVFNGFGCADTSDTAQIVILPSPASPVISQVGSVLSVPTASSYQWYLNGLTIPNATTSSFTATATGNYAVMITDAQGCAAYSETLSLVVGLAAQAWADLQLYPNPFQSDMHIAGSLKKGGQMEISLYNTAGQAVVVERIQVPAGAFAHTLKAAELPAGYYICQMRMGNEVLRQAMIKQ